MNTFWYAHMETENFTWDAFGSTEKEAKDILVKTFRKHLKQSLIPFSFKSNGEFLDYYGVNTQEVEIGSGLCDMNILYKREAK